MKNILLILFLISAAVACQYGREFAQDNEALAKLVRIDTLYRKNDAYEKLFYWQFLDNGEVRQCRVSLADQRTVGIVEMRPRPLSYLTKQVFE
jgi:hypothetical protein